MIEKIEEMVKNRLEEAIREEMKNVRRDSVFHVTELSYDCLRKIYYEKKHGVKFDDNAVVRMLIGRKLHEIAISEKHETHFYDVLFHYGSIHVIVEGTADEMIDIDDKTVAIIDKKFVSVLPSSPYGNHKQQVEYYAGLLHHVDMIKTDTKIYCGLLYFDVKHNNKSLRDRMKTFFWTLPDAEEVFQQLKYKARELYKHLSEDKTPPATVTEACRWCVFALLCKEVDGR